MVGTEPVQVADRVVPVDIAHGARPMTSTAIRLAVVEAVAGQIGFHLGDRVEPAGRLVEQYDAAAQGQQHAAGRTR